VTLGPSTSPKAARSLRVAFRTFGCKLNLYESSGITQAARARGHRILPGDAGEPADVIVVNTCSVTMRADQEARQFLRAAHRRNPRVRLVVTGCYAQRAPRELAALPGVALVAGHAEKDVLAGLLDDLPPEGAAARIAVADIAGKGMPALRASGVEERTRALLRVQDGCDAACTYCIIPRTRGASHSLGLEDAVEEGRRLLVTCGFREVVLTGTHLGHYGLDIERRPKLSELVERLLALPVGHAYRLRLSSVEPQEIDGRLIDLLATRPELSGHLHLPLQSGSDPMLRAMRRAYRTGNYRRQVLRVAARVRPLALGADLIVGFPGETEEDFRRTLDFLVELPFTHLHPFTYSPRPGTPAASWPGRPPGPVAARRLAAARALVAHKNRVFLEGLLGTTARVLVEGTASDGDMHGLSDHYVRVDFRAPRPLTGRFALVRLDALTDHGLRGTLERAIP